MAMWRCQNEECSEDPSGRLIFDFEVADGQPPICPSCKADVRKPEQRFTLVKLETVHLHVKDPNGPDVGRGHRYRVACGGGMKGKRVSAEASASSNRWKPDRLASAPSFSEGLTKKGRGGEEASPQSWLRSSDGKRHGHGACERS
jgi:hypothetical protein